MSKVKNLILNILEALEDGCTIEDAASIFEVPPSFVNEIYQNYADYKEPDDSMDGDFDSAMTSAGFGTDEDYNHYE